jgi:para-aminobenzoate synthetase component I
MEIEQLATAVDPIGLVAHPDLDDAAMVTVDGWTVVVGDPLAVVESLSDLTALGSMLRWRTGGFGAPASGVPFTSGAVGWIGDAVARSLLAIDGVDPRSPTPTSGIRFGVHDVAVCIAPGGTAYVAAADIEGLTHEASHIRMARWRALATSAAARGGSALPGGAVDRVSSVMAATPGAPPTTRWSLSEAAHAAAVHRAQDWISAGDLYQLNLTLQVRVPWARDGAALARRLFSASAGAAHRAWLRTAQGIDVVSISPETFLRVEGKRIVTRPIKGTRPRRGTPAADRAEAAALQHSAKDRAEHVMIVDLERNDLGRICEVGSVTVPDLLELEEHPTVWHLASTVRGVLRADVGLVDVLGATFPPGSVTGAPKRMAWERITALEPVRRGVYCGAVGVVTPGGCDLSVAIRTAVLADGEASYGTGGGIVADSTAAAEWSEAMDKARAFGAATGAHLRASPDRP